MRQNSWATGDNPEVNSIYLRLVRLNPALKDHATNVAVSGSNVNDLVRQAEEAVALQPLPELYLISSVDNDIRCDGTDDQNYGVYADQLHTALKTITTAAPNAQVFIVSHPFATEENYAEVLAKIGAKDHIAGDGPCDLFDLAGKLQPKRLRYLAAVTGRYYHEAAQACAEFLHCLYDGGAVHKLVIGPADLTPDHNHLSIAGQRKEAATVWTVLDKNH